MPLHHQRINNFNFLRLAFASLVLVSHAPELVDGNRDREILSRLFGTLSFGELAVDGFFLLSGYLIVQSWQNGPDMWQFLRKRFLRIVPGFLAASAICVFVVAPMAGASFDVILTRLGGIGLGALFLQVPIVPDVFVGSAYPGLNNSMWTISKEFCCYLVVAALGALGAVRIRSMWLACTIILFSLFIAQRFGLGAGGSDQGLRLMCMFFVGGSHYLYRAYIPQRRGLALLCVVVLLIGMRSWKLAEPAVALAGGYLIFYTAFMPSVVLTRFQEFPDVSYGVYLYGWPVQKLLLWYGATVSPWTLLVLSSVLCVGLGTASWFAIEKPALRFKNSAATQRNRSGEDLPL
jgi:peptidoglycan/LPS O-acetylase OafA/YrhL